MRKLISVLLLIALTACLFTVEFTSVGTVFSPALLPSFLSALVASKISGLLGVHAEGYLITQAFAMTIHSCWRYLILAVLVSLVGILMCTVFHKAEHFAHHHIPNPFVRIAAGGIVIMALTLLVGDHRFNGAGMDLVPCVIIMITSLQGVESGCLFALITTLLYCFSGSAPGPYVLPMITILAMLAAIFRQACLRKGFFSILLSTGAGMVCYELLLFFIGLFLRYTTWQRFGEMVLTALLSLLAVPVAYPILMSIGKLGGDTDTWKE